MAKSNYRHPKGLTDYEKQYIDNHTRQTINQVCTHLNRSFTIVKAYILKNKLPYNFCSSGRPLKVKIIKTHTPAKIVTFTRPPAKYSNTDWEKHFNQKYGTK